MAKNTYKSNNFKQGNKKDTESTGTSKFSLSFFKDPRFHLALGFFLLITSFYMLVAFVSYLFTGKADHSVVEAFGDITLIESGREAENWLGLYGAIMSHYVIFRWFGIAAFFIPPFLFLLGFRLVFKRSLVQLMSAFTFVLFSMVWISLLMGSMTLHTEGVNEWSFLGGGLGHSLAIVTNSMLGWGTYMLLILTLFVFIIYFFNITAIRAFQFKDPKPMGNAALDDEFEPAYTDDRDNWKEKLEEEAGVVPVVEELKVEPVKPIKTKPALDLEIAQPEQIAQTESKDEPAFTVAETKTDEKVVEHPELYDPTLDLSSYKFPPVDLLNEFDTGKVQVTKEELEENKDRIVATLQNFKIGIQSIKATIGPTVTLYEIVPDAGIKISRIKNLEDDIALSLAALGIRIIAPIPGRGTIGIEVPNKNREMVGIRSVLTTEKFMKSDKELPVVLGKTISNEV